MTRSQKKGSKEESDEGGEKVAKATANDNDDKSTVQSNMTKISVLARLNWKDISKML